MHGEIRQLQFPLLQIRVYPCNEYSLSVFRYEEYQKSLGSGKKELTRKEFKRVYNSLFAGDASDFAEHVFRTFDADGSGSVNFKEFVVGLCVSGSTDLETKLKWAFTVYDIDGNGYIDKDEMRHIISVRGFFLSIGNVFEILYTSLSFLTMRK